MGGGRVGVEASGSLGRSLANFSQFCVHFWGFLGTSYVILVFFTDIFRFWMDFGWFLEGFGKVFGGPFRRFFTFFAQIAILCESQQNTAWAHEFSRSTFQKTRKFPKKCQKKLMKLYGWKKQGQNSHKYWIWDGLGLIRHRFGRVLEFFWALLAASWSFFGRSSSNFFLVLAQHGLQKAFWIHFGLIWEGI